MIAVFLGEFVADEAEPGSRRPTILAVIESPSQQVYFEYDRDNFDWHFYLFNPAITPADQVEEVLAFIRQKRLRVDGIFGITDEPSIVAALTAGRLGLPGNRPEAIYRAQHKAILTQMLADISVFTPETCVISSPTTVPNGATKYPAFLKPAKGSLSMHSYMVRNRTELALLLPQLFREQRPLVDWSERFYRIHMQPADPPIRSFLLQPFLDLPQYTVDGFVSGGHVTILGITESVYTPDRKSFERFDYPGDISARASGELTTLLTTLLGKLQYDNSGFNMEFFVTPDDHIIVIELNTRLSVQFVPLMRQRYNHSNIHTMATLSTGVVPSLQVVNGTRRASSCVLRTYEDKRVVSVPDAADIRRLIADD